MIELESNKSNWVLCIHFTEWNTFDTTIESKKNQKNKINNNYLKPILNDLELASWVEPIFFVAFLFLGFDAARESKRNTVSWPEHGWTESWKRLVMSARGFLSLLLLVFLEDGAYAETGSFCFFVENGGMFSLLWSQKATASIGVSLCERL